MGVNAIVRDMALPVALGVFKHFFDRDKSRKKDNGILNIFENVGLAALKSGCRRAIATA